MQNKMIRDILVKTENPESLDRTMQSMGAAVVGGGMPSGYIKVDGCYVVRCFSDYNYIKFVITHQGYGEFVRELPELV